MKLKLSGLLIVMCFIFAAGVYYADEINAQDKIYKVGDKGPAGGWVFYDKGKYSDGWRYLESAPVDQSAGVKWGCYSTPIPGAKGTAIGTGKANTDAIVKNCEELSIAAKIAVSYRGGDKSDWFLPSKDELYLMYVNLYKSGVGGFTDTFTSGAYWSSSENDDTTSWKQYFSNGSQSNFGKGVFRRVRAVRVF